MFQNGEYVGKGKLATRTLCDPGQGDNFFIYKATTTTTRRDAAAIAANIV